MEGVERWELFPLEKYGLFRFQQPGNSAASCPRSLRKCTRKTYGGVGTSYCPVSSRMAWAEGSSPLPELRDGLSYHSLESQLTTVADLCLITWAWTSALDTVWIPHVPDVSGSTQSFTLASLAEDSMVLGRPCAFWSAASFCFAAVGAPGGRCIPESFQLQEKDFGQEPHTHPWSATVVLAPRGSWTQALLRWQTAWGLPVLVLLIHSCEKLLPLLTA